MRTIALVTQKGGSGKSTLSASVAVEMQARGETVFLVDMDPQGSLATWARGRTDRRLAGAAVGAAQLDQVMASLTERGVTLAIIDTPASLSAASEAAMLAADLIVIPVRPTVFDIWSSEATWQRVRDLGKDCAFVLNQCSSLQGSRRIREGAAALEAMGGLLSPLITSRVEYQDAMLRGLGPTELDPTGPAADEIRQLCDSLRRRMALDRFHERLNQIAA
ncbi:MAG: AAA family ATPase [Janthinobacterium lividum]